MVVEAFLDGEPVDPIALTSALADAGGRDHLVDLLMMRGAIGGDVPRTWNAPPHRGSKRRWLAAAAAAIISLAAGYLTGQRTAPAAGVPASVEAVIDLESSPAAPAPTRVIALKPGVNWTEHSKGQ